MLQKKYPGQDFLTGSSPDLIAVFAAKHPKVGDLSIRDYAGEALVSIGDLTHGHFSNHDSNLSEDDAAGENAEEVLDFLEAFFADKYLVWKSRKDGSGGWQHLEYMDKPLEREKDTDYFVWSGPFLESG
jgi:hypothetical protein